MTSTEQRAREKVEEETLALAERDRDLAQHDRDRAIEYLDIVKEEREHYRTECEAAYAQLDKSMATATGRLGAMHRRAQSAESGLAAKLHAIGPGSMGRACANSAARMYQSLLLEARDFLRRGLETIEPCPWCGSGMVDCEGEDCEARQFLQELERIGLEGMA